MIEISKHAEKAVKGFIELESVELFSGKGNSVSMKLFMPRLNSKEFDMASIQECLEEVVTDFALSRVTIQKYKRDEEFQKMTREAREKFRNYKSNKGELGELILYTFLEGHLNAPQILSKMSLKTTNGDYTKKSDGLHFLKLKKSERYHLIFGESKTIQNLTKAFKEALTSISDHKEGKNFEKSLISSQLQNEFIDDEDRKMIVNLLYPSKSPINIKVSDAFGIFIGFELNIPEERKELSEDNFEEWINNDIRNQVIARISKIENYISEKKLTGKNFYVYLMPFTNLNETREKITEGITK